MDYDTGEKVSKNLFLLIFLMSSIKCKLWPTRLQIIDFTYASFLSHLHRPGSSICAYLSLDRRMLTIDKHLPSGQSDCSSRLGELRLYLSLPKSKPFIAWLKFKPSIAEMNSKLQGMPDSIPHSYSHYQDRPSKPEFHCYRLQGRGENYFVPLVGHN